MAHVGGEPLASLAGVGADEDASAVLLSVAVACSAIPAAEPRSCAWRESLKGAAGPSANSPTSQRRSAAFCGASLGNQFISPAPLKAGPLVSVILVASRRLCRSGRPSGIEVRNSVAICQQGKERTLNKDFRKSVYAVASRPTRYVFVPPQGLHEKATRHESTWANRGDSP